MKNQTINMTVDFLGVNVECSFSPCGFGYKSSITELDAKLCYQAALRFLTFDSLKYGDRIEVYSAAYKSVPNEYCVKLRQTFPSEFDNRFEVYTIKVCINEFPDNKTYLAVTDSYMEFAQ